MFRRMRSYTCRFHSRPSFNPRGWHWASIASATSNSVPYHIKFKLIKNNPVCLFAVHTRTRKSPELSSFADKMSVLQHIESKEEAESSRSTVRTADCCLDSCFCISILVENKQPSLKLILLCHNKVLAIWTEMTIFISMFMHQRLINVLVFSFIGGFSLYSFSRSDQAAALDHKHSYSVVKAPFLLTSLYCQ